MNDDIIWFNTGDILWSAKYLYTSTRSFVSPTVDTIVYHVCIANNVDIGSLAKLIKRGDAFYVIISALDYKRIRMQIRTKRMADMLLRFIILHETFHIWQYNHGLVSDENWLETEQCADINAVNCGLIEFREYAELIWLIARRYASKYKSFKIKIKSYGVMIRRMLYVRAHMNLKSHFGVNCNLREDIQSHIKEIEDCINCTD